MKRTGAKLVLTIVSLALLALAAGAFALAEGGAPVITGQPESVDTVSEKVISLQTSATGSGLRYQWYRRNNANDSWTAWSGKTQSLLWIYSTIDMDGMQVRCVVSNATGSATTSAATIRIIPNIWSYSYVLEGLVGEKKTLSVNANGKDLKYQWYYKATYNGNWIAWLGATSNEYELVLSKEYDGYYFQCVVTAGNGMTVSTWEKRDYFNTFRITVTDPSEFGIAPEETLYFLDDNDLECLALPNDLPQSLDLSGHKLEIVSGDNLDITDGLIRPKKTKWYYHQLESGYWVGSTGPSGQEGEIVREQYEAGDSVISVDGNIRVTFHVVNYAVLYAEGVMDQYLGKNITAGMTEYQKAEKCCQFVAGYDYGVDYTSYTGLIVHGSGDCWSSTGALMYMLPKVGITCKSRYAGYDSGAGSGHYNVLATLDGVNYILDAGFVGSAPRHYSITAYGSPFSYSMLTSTTVAITNYVSMDGETEIDVPAQINGYTVTAIGEGAFSSNNSVKRIHLPDTITSIGKKAFNDDKALESVNIPEGVTSIGSSAFAWCASLTSLTIPASVTEIGVGNSFYCSNLSTITVDPANTVYRSIDGVVFSKDGRTLVMFPPGRSGTYQVPSGVTTIATYAFCSAYSLSGLTFPDSLRTIEPSAFYHASIRDLILPEGLETVGESAFYRSSLSLIQLPNSLKRIETGAFAKCDTVFVTLPAQLEYIGDYAFAGDINLSDVSIPASVKEIGEGAFWLDYGWSSMDASAGEPSRGRGIISLQKGCAPTIGVKAFQSATMGVFEGSSAHKYAQDNSVYFVLLDANGKVRLDASWFEIDSYPSFTGQPLMPEVTISKNAPVSGMSKNLDYTVRYSDNILPGNGTVTVEGRNLFSGSVTLDFRIFTSDLNGDSRWNTDDILYGLLGHAPTSVLRLPAGTTTVEAQAFAGVPAEAAYIPASVKTIANDAFDPGVILVLQNDTLAAWARERGYIYAVGK